MSRARSDDRRYALVGVGCVLGAISWFTGPHWLTIALAFATCAVALAPLGGGRA